MRRRAALGAGAVAVGVALVTFDASTPSARAGFAAVLLVAGGALLVGVSRALERGAAPVDRWDPPTPEAGYRVPVPGDELEERGFGAGPESETESVDDPGSHDRGRAGESDERVAARGDAPGATSLPEPGDGVVDHVTNRWTGVSAVALVLGSVGVVTGADGLVLGGAVGAVFAGYVGLVEPPRVRAPAEGTSDLTVIREVSEPSPDPGDDVEVRVAVRNDGGATLTDVRVVDGVPAALPVIDGSPRHGAVLRPGGTALFAYTVRATRGDHRWRGATVAVADPAGTVEREVRVPAETTLACRRPPTSGEELPLRGLGSRYVGRVVTDTGGSGLEFHATREFRPSDPLSRIDWNRLARAGDLATLEFREERAATVMLVLDTRRAAYRAPGPDGHHAVQRSVDAAHSAFASLLDAGDRVGIASFGPRSEECWLPPGAGDGHRSRGRDLLDVHPSFSSLPPARTLYARFRPERRETLERRRIARLHRRLSSSAQVVFFSPCCDDYAADIASVLDAYGRPVTVVSPDPSVADTAPHEQAQRARTDRIRHLRRSKIRVLDWAHDESFDAALTRANARWST